MVYAFDKPESEITKTMAIKPNLAPSPNKNFLPSASVPQHRRVPDEWFCQVWQSLFFWSDLCDP
jgi:hypothetical protein